MMKIKKEKAESTPLLKKRTIKVEPVTPQSKKVDVKIESTPQSKKLKVKNKSKLDFSMVAIKKEKAESTPLPQKKAIKVEPVTPQSKKVNESIPQSKKLNVKIKCEPKKAMIKAVFEPKISRFYSENLPKRNVAAKAPVKRKTEQVIAENQSLKNVQKRENEVEKTIVGKLGKSSPFVGVIRSNIDHHNVSLNDVKSALSRKIDAKKIVGLRLRNDHRNVFVFVKNEDTLNLMLNNFFTVNKNFKFVVYDAKNSTSNKKPNYVEFVPHAPSMKTVAEVKDAVVKCVGVDCVAAVKFREVFETLKIRHVLVQFTDVKSLEKMIQQGELQVGSDRMIVRPVNQNTVDDPKYKVLFTSIPKNTSPAVLKKAIESQVGQDTVRSIQFSPKQTCFAYVLMKTEDAQMKTLEVGGNVRINGTKLEVCEFKPHKPAKKKRAAPSEQAEERKKNKARKQKLADGTANDGNQKQGLPSLAIGPALGKNAKKKLLRKLEQNAAHLKSQSPNPVSVSVNGACPSIRKQKKKNKNKQQQQSPKPVDAKKQALVAKISSKKKNKKNSMKQHVS